jgi:putative zinc finger/helix-turn-helix YgiT family protein
MRQPPWKCRNCGEVKVCPVILDYSTEMDHDGRTYHLNIPKLELSECEVCKNQTVPDASFERIVDALRLEAKLLTPAKIKGKRKRLGLTQEQLADCLGVAKETVCRWETGGQIQQRAMDKLLRAFFDVPQLRKYLGFSGTKGTNGSAKLLSASDMPGRAMSYEEITGVVS